MRGRIAHPHMPEAIAAVTGVSVALLVVGWHAGYHSLPAYALFWLSSAAVTLTALELAGRTGPAGRADLCVRAGTLVLAEIVGGGLVLGATGLLTPHAFCALTLALLVASRALAAPAPAAAPNRPDGRLPVVVGIAGALVVFVAGYGMSHSPFTLYDSLSYHLYFPARWLQDARLSVIATPFSDPAQAYAPGNGELFFLWLMLPFHGDLAARVGQLPFYVFCAAALYALARRVGARPEHAAYPAAFFLLARPVMEQGVGANVDLVCTGMFLASLYFGIRAVDSDDARDWLLFGVGLGLYYGTKYLALAYTPVLLLLMFSRGVRRRMLWALPGVLVFGLPWYARNWILAGSPIYPASLQAVGITIARGAFTRASMVNTVFHTNDLHLLPAILARAFGPTLFVCGIPFALVGAVSMIRRAWWPARCLLLVPILMLPLYWYGLPVNLDPRFLLPAVGPALLPLAFAFGSSRAWNGTLHAAYLAGCVWILAGVHASLPATLPWFMAGWLSLDGLVPGAFLLLFAAVASGIAIVWWASPSRARVATTAFAILAAGTGLALAGEHGCAGAPCEYLDTTSPYIRSGLLTSWTWVSEHVQHGTIAYTGINLPYALFGPQFTNRVMYVNIDGHLRWRLHDYDRAYRAGRFSPQPPLLATSSGELEPIAPGQGPRSDAIRPRYERMEGYEDLWVANLRALGVTHVFVSALSAYEIDNVWHNDGGFPIEDEWARRASRMFDVIYESPQARIYAFTPPPGK